jgi:hypothetical protein
MTKEASKTTPKAKKTAGTRSATEKIPQVPTVLAPDEIPALPKQFSESLKRIGEQAKEWQTKKITSPAAEETSVLPVPKVKAPAQAKQPFNWTIVSMVLTVIVLGLFAAQSIWLRQRLEILSHANQDLKMQVQGLEQELKAKDEAKPPVATTEDESLDRELERMGG